MSASFTQSGGWNLGNQEKLTQGSVTSIIGLNVLRLEREDPFPHIKGVAFIPTTQ
jgi:hypothetical protein